MKRTLKKGICIATAAMMVAGMTSVTALADDTKASGKINFYYWDADQTNEVNKVIELFNEQNPANTGQNCRHLFQQEPDRMFSG